MSWIARAVPWLLAAASLACYGSALALRALAASADARMDAQTPVVLGTFLAYAAVGAVVAARRPGHPIGWLLLLMGVVMEVQGVADAARSVAPGSAMPPWLLDPWVMAPLANLWNVSFTGLALLLVLFPTGRLASGRLWPVFPLAVVVVVAGLLASGSADRDSAIRFPLFAALFDPATAEVLYEAGQGVSGIGLMILLVLGAGSMAARLRAARGVERQQMKWFAYASMLLALVFVGTAVAFFSPLRALDPGARIPPAMFGGVPFVVAMMAVPVAAGVAILRYRLYDIDVLINRTLVYGALTAMLGGMYVAAVIGSQAVLDPLTSGNEIAVAASTLLVVALFQPLRHRIQRAVDRRFYRSRYDAQRTLDVFSARLRDEVDLDDVRTQLLAAVHATLQPRGASLWLRSASPALSRNDFRTPDG